MQYKRNPPPVGNLRLLYYLICEPFFYFISVYTVYRFGWRILYDRLKSNLGTVAFLLFCCCCCCCCTDIYISHIWMRLEKFQCHKNSEIYWVWCQMAHFKAYNFRMAWVFFFLFYEFFGRHIGSTYKRCLFDSIVYCSGRV